ncbi:hypothetical protein ACFP81_06520 [Deinococcus lacus]|uniref:Uncharacterized protein n=1 Tax=Deinococcus lacus TaxID=392561 RepID=A0ABW1YDS6_9DEIO
MKQVYTVRAHRTETKYDAKDNLISLLDVQVPADAVEFLRSAHYAQEHKDVTFNLRVVNATDGDYRTLKFTSKGSKMKDFVPVATLQKWADSHDDLNSLFDYGLELELQVEVRERNQDGPGLFDEGEETETLQAGVLNAPKGVLALPGGEDIEDAEFEEADQKEAQEGSSDGGDAA